MPTDNLVTMAASKQPKVLLFDMGGVCVDSPFQVILDYELSLGIPPGWINYSISQTAPNGFWHKLELGAIPLDQTAYDGFNHDLHDPERWKAFYEREQRKHSELPRTIPPVPTIDGKVLLNAMMMLSTSPDPWMTPALKNLRESGRYILGALSNTIIFPPGHALHEDKFFESGLRQQFDIFISSAHVHLRKPDPQIYELAVRELDKFAKENATTHEGLGWEEGVQPEDVVFLDDIGENLKSGRQAGFRTIKVPLGRAYEAVEDLETLTGLKLAGSHPKIPAVKPKYHRAIAKI